MMMLGDRVTITFDVSAHSHHLTALTQTSQGVSTVKKTTSNVESAQILSNWADYFLAMAKAEGSA